ncbi:retrovirus-related pol polyprotein from transposon TNT 1-94 [Tanacetum coccineum]
MDNPNITMEEYIRLPEEKALSCGETFDWQTATYGKMEYYENEDDSFMNFKTEYPTIVFDDTSDTTLLCEPTVSPLNNNKINFKISFNESDDEREPFISPQHVDEFNMKDETSLSECDGEEQNILYFHDLFPFNVIYADDSKSDKDNDDDKIDIKKSLGGNVINTDDGAYAHGFGIQRIKELNVNIMAWNYLNNGMLLNLIKNLYVPFCIPFDPKLFYKDGIKLGQDATWRIIGFGIQRIDLLYNVFNCFPAESLNVTFDETPPPSKTSPLVDDELDEEEAIKITEKKKLENNIEDETLEVDEILNIKESKNHPLGNVIGNLNQITLRFQVQNQGTKWVYRNKLDENGVVSHNKARLVAQEYNQQEGIDYDETYASVARLESIRILLAYACSLDFKLFQIDVKSAFLNGFINEEVYVAQPLGFIDFEKPNHVYKIKEALYGLKQAPKAWQLKNILEYYNRGAHAKKPQYAILNFFNTAYRPNSRLCNTNPKYEFRVKMDEPNITIEEYIRLEEEKARRHAIVFNDMLKSKAASSCEPMVSSLNNDEINFRISFDESNDEDCTDLVKEKSTNDLWRIYKFGDLEVLES